MSPSLLGGINRLSGQERSCWKVLAQMPAAFVRDFILEEFHIDPTGRPSGRSCQLRRPVSRMAPIANSMAGYDVRRNLSGPYTIEDNGVPPRRGVVCGIRPPSAASSPQLILREPGVVTERLVTP